MAACLIALGSNLGDRAAHLRQAVDQLARTPHTRLVARSPWHETSPIGGPAGQEAFLNGAALVSTALAPPALMVELLCVESSLHRVRTERWGARTIDLDVLLYDELTYQSAELTIPHPRMHYRRFVLEPAVQVAPWMVHPGSGWTVAQLLDQLNRGADVAAIAAADPRLAEQLAAQIVERLELSQGDDSIQVVRWPGEGSPAGVPRPKLLLAVGDATGGNEPATRTMLHLPTTGPVAWLTPGATEALLGDALAALASVRPAFAPRGDD